MNPSKYALLSLLIPSIAFAQAKSDTTIKVTFGAFVDGYYAWDFGEPVDFDRSFFGGALFTTQPTRHNEFNINLAYAEAKVEGARLHGRFALQAGTSVQSNYGGEPAIGVISGPSLSRMIQEAFAGVKVGENVWIDGGIFFSHMGMESWISRDNPTYTRSLVAEYSPYYSSGVRAIWQTTAKLTMHLHVVNGWQNISENNTGKGAGIRLDYAANDNATISYYNFFSDEAVNIPRTFNGVGAKVTSGKWAFVGQADVGTQDTSSWYGLLAIARYRATSNIGVVLRGERYEDDDQVIVVTGIPLTPLQANGASLGVDYAPSSRVVWRTELRGFWNDEGVFQNHKSIVDPRTGGGFAVSSLALSF